MKTKNLQKIFAIKDFYEYLTSEEESKIISNGWKAAFIVEAIEKGSKSLDPLDPFYEVAPLTNEVNEMFEVIRANQDYISSFVTRSIDGYEEEWECKGEPLNKIFEILNEFK